MIRWLARENLLIGAAILGSAALVLSALPLPMHSTFEGEMLSYRLYDSPNGPGFLPAVHLTDTKDEVWAYLDDSTGFEPGDVVKVECSRKLLFSNKRTGCSVIDGKWGGPPDVSKIKS